MFKNSLGTYTPTEHSIFPLLSHNPETDKWKCVGTGFFIHAFGGFVTAKHVLFDNSGKKIPSLYAVQTIDQSQNIRCLRQAEGISLHPNADICIGMLTKPIPKTFKKWDIKAVPFSLDFSRINNDEKIKSYAFPLTELEIDENGLSEFTFNGKWSEGKIVDFLEEGSPIVRNKVYQTTMKIDFGASGGPVLRNNLVIGINSSGMDDNEPIPVSFVTPIDYLLEMQIKEDGRLISVRELVENKYIRGINF